MIRIKEKKRPKYRQIAEELRESIVSGRYRPGQILPSNLELAEQHGVALMTMRHAVTSLQREGLISSKNGVGTYVSKAGLADPEPVRKSGFARAGMAMIGEFVGDAIVSHNDFLKVKNQLKERGIILTSDMFQDNENELVSDWAAANDISILYNRVQVRLVEKLLEKGRNVLVLGHMLDGECPKGARNIVCDVRTGVELALSILHGYGHRRICVVHSGNNSYQMHIRDSFFTVARNRGLGKEVSELVLPETERSDEKEIIQGLTSNTPRVGAFVVEGGLRACRILRTLERLGLGIPEEMSMIAISNAAPNELAVNHIGRIDLNSRKYLQTAASLLPNMISGCDSENYVIPPSAELGTTVGTR
jgi:DNA-binding transcriptional regulator YhcF (GntR family)